jgi:predicted hydrocarbon binding protein
MTMKDSTMNRKEFLAKAGKVCACAAAAAAAGGLTKVVAQEAISEAKPDSLPKPAEPRAVKRMEFTEGWVKRFFDAVDGTLDQATRKKLMMANGKACYLAWIKDTKQEIKPITLEQFKKWVDTQVKDGSYRVEGNVIYFQYMGAAETGLPADENACLCPLVETKPDSLSPTYCFCSVGYVKEMHEGYLNRPVDVELMDSVLKGGKRCQFKITVA